MWSIDCFFLAIFMIMPASRLMVTISSEPILTGPVQSEAAWKIQVLGIPHFIRGWQRK